MSQRILFMAAIGLSFVAVGSAQKVLVNEPFSGGPGLPSGWTLQAGTATVAGGVLKMNSACVQLPGTFNRAEGLIIEADVTIKNAAVGDFEVYALYDTLANCGLGPPNGYVAGWFPAGSDDPVDKITKKNPAVFGGVQLLASTPTTLAGNTKFRLRQEILPDGTINTYINGRRILTTVDNSLTSGPISFHSFLDADVDNVLVTTVQPEGSYQVRYVSNLNLGDSVVNITNSGARGAGQAAGTSASTTGAICANVYAFSPDEQMVSCCTCPVTPNGLVRLSVRSDIISNTLTPAVPTALVIKLYATAPVGGSCAAAAANPLAAPSPGMIAWGTTVHTGPVAGQLATTETPFLYGTLSAGELDRLVSLCTFINANGSGFGVCRSCQLGALGSGRL